MQTWRPGSAAGPSSLPAATADLSATQAAAGLPPMHRSRTRRPLRPDAADITADISLKRLHRLLINQR
ncbi:g5460 [Coccomyxa viridis]|uniref:G5460 protein n=1 Tax=Coccomyxa viridis TaxID=1274662 RepID=A0ABP1FVN2_9CHLO